MKLNIIDSIMGSGKTTYITKMIKERKDERFIFVTPYLTEQKRIKNELLENVVFYEPKISSKSKSNDLYRLVEEKKNIVTTHALFSNLKPDIANSIAEAGYVLIMDEAMEVVKPLMSMFNSDFEILASAGAIVENPETKFLEWKLPSYEGVFSTIKEYVQENYVVKLSSGLLLWHYPYEIFEAFSEIWILTYMYDAQFQSVYFSKIVETFNKYQIINGELVEYDKRNEAQEIRRLKSLISVYGESEAPSPLNDIGDKEFSLSYSWYSNADNKSLEALRKNLLNWFNNYNRGVKSKNKLWTTFKDYQSKLEDLGYVKSFAPINIRATNEYLNCDTLAYTINKFMMPSMKQYALSNNIIIKEDDFALSEMLQWIWRSAVRVGSNISIYIPSKRMRKILLEYLDQYN